MLREGRLRAFKNTVLKRRFGRKWWEAAVYCMMRSPTVSTLHQVLLKLQMKEAMSGECRRWETGEKCTKFLLESLEKQYDSEGIDLRWRTTF